MNQRVKNLRSVNFAFPWSERSEYFMPSTVRLLAGASALTVLVLVALPFYLQHLVRAERSGRAEVTQIATNLREQVERAAPLLERTARLDSLHTLVFDRARLRDRIARTDYPIDRLLLHLAEVVPDGVVLTGIDVRPPATTAAGRVGLSSQPTNLPPEIQSLWILTLQGTTRNAPTITALRRALEESPLYHLPEESVTPVQGTVRDLTFTISARLPGTGEGIEEGG